MVTGKIFTESFSVLMKDINPKVQEAHGVLYSINDISSTSRHTVVRMVNAIEKFFLKQLEERGKKTLVQKDICTPMFVYLQHYLQ